MARQDRRSPRTRSVAVATGMLVLALAPLGVAAGGGVLRGGERNSTGSKETSVVGNVAERGNATGGYTTRQSNTSTSGGGAIYGCRARAGDGTNPCVRANNLADGLSFEFAARSGSVAGTISVGSGGDQKKPFTTNATGVATGLNADRVDGQSADDIVNAAATTTAAAQERWVLIAPNGTISAQSGGFTTINCYQANDNCYIDAGGDVRNNAVSASIVTANNPDAGTDGQLTGDISASPCFFDFVNCGPANTDSSNGGAPGVFVVTPRNSDGTAPAADDRYPFYAYVSGTEAVPAARASK